MAREARESGGCGLDPDLHTNRDVETDVNQRRGCERAMDTITSTTDDRAAEGVPAARSRGFTLIELLMALTLLAIVLGVGFRELRGFSETTIADRAARSIASDVSVTRSYAVQRGNDVSLAAQESDRRYVILDEATGDTLKVRSHAASSGLPLTLLDVQTSDDRLTFNSRGLLASGSSVDIVVARFDSGKKIHVSPLGRSSISVTTP